MPPVNVFKCTKNKHFLVFQNKFSANGCMDVLLVKIYRVKKLHTYNIYGAF